MTAPLSALTSEEIARVRLWWATLLYFAAGWALGLLTGWRLWERA